MAREDARLARRLERTVVPVAKFAQVYGDVWSEPFEHSGEESVTGLDTVGEGS